MTFSLSPGQAHDAPEGRKLLARMGPLDTRPALVMDRAYEGNEARQLALELGFTPVAPPRKIRTDPWEYDRSLYKRRNEVERLFRQVVVCTLETTPPGATHWSTRTIARAAGMSHATISRIWRAFGLQPHRTKTFKLSPDPWMVEKVRDIVGLYVNPPEHAVVLYVDEKPQIQALDRTAPVLPMLPGRCERRTHDYRRHGAVALFAALDVKTGKVIGALHRRHRTVEFLKFLKFLKRIDAETPDDLDVHFILDNYSTHKAPRVVRWLAAHPRFHFHFTPTYSSWLNLVERWFSALTTQQLRRGVCRSVVALERAIRTFLAEHNATGRPFTWTKSADEILASIARFAQRTLAAHAT